MVRFFQRGDDMEESKPFSFPFYYRQRVENGWFTQLKAAIMVDRKKGREAMLEKDKTLGARGGEGAEEGGGDGKMYYIMEGDIKVTPRSADMAYVFYL
ncbi:hypothetical protein QC764_0058220 [Podospora pseudoanserina]|uniref:Cyclic nucleotide-binding domain-containing protein n=1 Tax=Podospora pseudoanserina TaxID=2609844 RepID=A0ABR0IFX1_9PEZI|nr:hypothetical protein QC764_0058220 [Podospora pseudoanserina]